MPNYANTQLYELIEHDEEGNAHVYRGHTTQPLHKRLAQHRSNFKSWKEGRRDYCSSFEVLKHGLARIELVRVVSCFNVKEANREEGKFIRELPTCVNTHKNTFANFAEWYEKNKEPKNAYDKAYRKANKETIFTQRKAYRHANKDTIKAKNKKRYEANKDTILAKKKAYHFANRDTILAKNTEKVTCECGAVVRRGSLSDHRNRMTHIKALIYC
jgi:hypothetical protein